MGVFLCDVRFVGVSVCVREAVRYLVRTVYVFMCVSLRCICGVCVQHVK